MKDYDPKRLFILVLIFNIPMLLSLALLIAMTDVPWLVALTALSYAAVSMGNHYITKAINDEHGVQFRRISEHTVTCSALHEDCEVCDTQMKFHAGAMINFMMRDPEDEYE